MFRRIELISELRNDIGSEHYREALENMLERDDLTMREITFICFTKSGLCGFGNSQVMAAWDHMPSPRRRITRNCRFFFTEEGWRKYGRPTITVCQQTHQRYRVISIKEKSVDVLYRDDVQVAVRPTKQRGQTPRSRPFIIISSQA
jgi:hypothetical protein